MADDGTFPPGLMPPAAAPSRPPYPGGGAPPPYGHPAGQPAPGGRGYAPPPHQAGPPPPRAGGYPPPPMYGGYPPPGQYPPYGAPRPPYPGYGGPLPPGAYNYPPPGGHAAAPRPTPAPAPAPAPAPSAPIEKKTSVYVGKIPDGILDESIKRLLEQCGGVVSWKRVEDVETKKPKVMDELCTHPTRNLHPESSFLFNRLTPRSPFTLTRAKEVGISLSAQPPMRRRKSTCSAAHASSSCSGGA